MLRVMLVGIKSGLLEVPSKTRSTQK